MIAGGVQPTAAAVVPGAAAAVESSVSDADATALTEDQALVKAKSSGERVEVTSLRGEASEVYATPSGDLEAVEHLRPVRTRVGGEWTPIDTTLHRGTEGSVTPIAAGIGITLSGGGDQPLVTLERGGRELSLSWPSKLPEPALDGDTATYASVLPDVDLRVRAEVDGISQVLVVKSAQAAANPQLQDLRLAIDADGMTVRETEDGGLSAVDDTAGGPVFQSAQPVMWDSGTQPADSAAAGAATSASAVRTASLHTASTTGTEASDDQGPGDAAKIAPIGVEVASTADGGDELRLTPDQELLTSKDTTYPVYIDPQWYSPKTSAWAMVSRYWSSTAFWKFNGDSDAGMGYCAGDARCAPNDLKRLFYRIPTSRFAGKSILSAEFVVKETHSYSCDGRVVQLWRTKGISSSTTWNTQLADGFWIDQLSTANVAKGYSSSCPDGNIELNALDAVKYAASHSSSYTTFGLKAGSESDAYSWKRFSDDAYLRVKYNRPPSQIRMSQLTMDPGGDCDKPESKDRVRILPTVRANNVTDPDGDSIAVQFQASWDSGDGKGMIPRWTSSKSTYKKSGSDFSIALPSSVPKNKTVAWVARSYDSAQYSPWSYTGSATGCYFVYDTSVPAGPSIASGDYPRSDPEDPEDPWYDGAGRYGTFAIDSSSTDVTKYWFGINGDPTSAHTLTTSGGGAKTMKFMPTTSGVNYVTAQAFDAAGNGSEVRTYQFRVKAGQPTRAQWELDETAGATQAVGTAGQRTAELYGGAAAGAAGAVGTALSLDGTDDYAATDISSIDTSTSFSVSVWAKLSKTPDDAAVVVTQPGNHSPGFEIYYSKGSDRWAFNQYTADTTTATPVRAMQPAAGGAKVGEWAHLVGTYSAGTDELKLYVNGQLAGTTTNSTPWDARRGLQIGASLHSGVAGNFFPGVVDELRIFDKPLSAEEVSLWYSKAAKGPGRPARAVFPLDEPVGSAQVIGRAEVGPAVLMGGATAGATGAEGKALTLDGTNDYATTGGPVLNNQRSFAVAAWAKLPATLPTKAGVVAAQAGTARPGFELYYSASYGWTFGHYTADGASASIIRATQGSGSKAVPGEWTYLVGVHDDVTDEMRLYVNGTKVATTSATVGWYAGGAFQIGASSIDGAAASFFYGQIDDVQLYDRVVSDSEIKDLYKARPLVMGRWKLDASSGTPSTSPDDSVGKRSLTLGGNAAVDSSGSSNYIGTGGLLLDGNGDFASTAVSPVATSTSFTATAWVSTPARPDHSVTVFSQAGSVNSGFAVRYVPDSNDPENAGHWQLEMASADISGAVSASSEHGNFQNNTSWNHLAVVYDAFLDQMRLYVDGELEQTLCSDSDDDGTPDDSSCTERVSWNSDVLSFNATSGLQLGRSKTGGVWGEYWPGVIDDVWVLQGVASEQQIARLAGGEDLSTVTGP